MYSTAPVIIIGISLFLNVGNCFEKTPEIRTTNGPVVGFKQRISEKVAVDAFYGIPYAKPPVGDLRFKKPVPAEPWGGQILDATKVPRSCIQTQMVNMSGAESIPIFALFKDPSEGFSEDCLYLNVWAPSNTRDLGQRLDVLVYIHGGGFIGGAALIAAYIPTFLVARKNIIVVSMNYRLGPLGFLYLGTEDAPGNMGLMDQALALDWVRENIEAFGGNPNSVTIMGTSAGGASVSAHLLSPVSSPKFDRAVIQSGTINAHWSFRLPEDAKEKAYALANILGCRNIYDKSKLVKCLRQIPPQYIDGGMFKMVLRFLDIPFLPVADNIFLPDPEKFVKKETGNIKTNKDVFISTTAQESSLLLPMTFPKYFSFFTQIPLGLDQLMDIINSSFRELPIEHRELIHWIYTGWKAKGMKASYDHCAVNLYTDISFVCPSVNLASALAEKGSRVYYYSFQHETPTKGFAPWMGSTHGEDVPYILGHVFNSAINFTDMEELLSIRVMDYIGNFMHSGKPHESWPTFDRENKNYGILDLGQLRFNTSPREKYCKFWNSLGPAVFNLEAVPSNFYRTTNKACIGNPGFMHSLFSFFF